MLLVGLCVELLHPFGSSDWQTSYVIIMFFFSLPHQSKHNSVTMDKEAARPSEALEQTY
jgi:hypothetical protein